MYTIKDESGAAASNNITVATEGSETIDGSATDVLATNYRPKNYYSNGSHWFEVPVLPAVAVAHSATTGQGADNHHAEAHRTAHNSGGADALKLDDLNAPDDNTNLDFSTNAHGLEPKGPNYGTFLKADGSWAAPAGGGAITREGGQTTEATTISTSAVDLLNASSLTIAAAESFYFMWGARKTSGATDSSAHGVKLNTTAVLTAASGVGYHYTNAGADEAQEGGARVHLGANVTNYIHPQYPWVSDRLQLFRRRRQRGDIKPYPNERAAYCNCHGCHNQRHLHQRRTSGADEMHVYSEATS